MKQILRKTFLTLLGGIFLSSGAWADDLPTPVYFNDFETAVSGSDGIEIVGNGVFESDADARFGKIFHNDPTLTTAIRTNYLKLPTDVLKHSATSKEMTIGFWVNVKNATEMTNDSKFFYCPIFTAYGTANATDHAGDNWYPFFYAETRGVLGWNAMGWCNFTNSQNDAGSNAENTAWMDDAKWHYYSLTFTPTSAKVCIDGIVLNSWTISSAEVADNNGAGGLEGLFTQTNLDYVCLGGNQAWGWGDADPAFGFDDFAVYDKALTQAQIREIIKKKLAKGTPIGEVDNSTTYLTASSNKIVLAPGESAKYKFVNYIKWGANINEDWHLVVADPDDVNKIVIRTDWYDDLNGTTVAEHQRGFSTDAENYWDNVPSKMNWATVDMTVSFTAEKKFVMTSTTTAYDGTSWTYNYTSDNENNIDLTGLSSLKVALSVNLSWIDLLSSTISTTIGTKGWSTFSNANALDFAHADAGLTAYQITDQSEKVITKSAVTSAVPANTGLLLNGTAGSTYTIPVAASGTALSSNKLVAGTGSAISMTTGHTYYVLTYEDGDAQFKKLTSAVAVPVGKAYLDFPTTIEARSIDIDGDGTTGIQNMKVGKEDNVYYDLQGRRVLYPKKGLYIVNGKKVIMK